MPPGPDELLQQVPWVRSLAARLVFDRDRRAELEQEVWHAALRRPPGPGVPVRAWLAAVAHRLAALLHRSESRRVRREQAVARASAGRDPAELAAEAELQRRLLAAVHALPGPMRDVVLLRFLEGLPPRAIAAQLAVPVATVRTRQQRALALLRERLDADFGDRRTWVLALAALPRPRDVAAAAGLLPTVTHAAVTTMNANKLIVAAAAVAALATLPLLLRNSGGSRVAAAAPPATPVATATTADPGTRGAAAPSDRTAAAAPAGAPRALRGRVVDERGAPIAGALVRKTPVDTMQAHVEDGELAAHDVETTTDADGGFTLNDAGVRGESHALLAEHRAFVAAEAPTPCTFAAPVSIVMAPTHEVPLVVECVERASRVPVPRFLVTGTTVLQTRDAGRGAYPLHELRAPDAVPAANGRWHGTARFVEGRPFVVRVQCSGHGRGEWADADDPKPQATLAPLPGQPLHVVIEVDFDQAERVAPRVQRGRVVAAGDGAPLAGVDVCAVVAKANSTSFLRRVQTRADGTFAIALPKDGAACTLRVEHPDWQAHELAPDPAHEPTVRLAPRASLRVQVLGVDGRPLPRAHVLVVGGAPGGDDRGGERLHRRARTDEHGRIELNALPAGRYLVFVVPKRSSPDEHALGNGSWTLTPGQQLDATLELAPNDALQVTGRVLAAPAGLAPAFVPHVGTGRFVQAKLRDGGWDAGSLPPGDYLVALFAANDDDSSRLPKALLPTVTLRGSGRQVLDLTLATGFVRGRLVGARDAAALRLLALPSVPPGGVAAEMLASAKMTKFLGTAPAADGTFEVPHVADGIWRLQVRDGATVVAERPITVQGSLDVGDWRLDR
jgi:RNA polymerase sigma factor (sigma-70 family)